MTPVERFRALVRVPTMSRLDESEIDWTVFDTFIELLATQYPLVHAKLELEKVAGYSLLYRWPGASSAAPTVLMGHYDVVPATDERWEHPPFAAELVGEGEDAYLWGRGTLDDKGALVAILE